MPRGQCNAWVSVRERTAGRLGGAGRCRVRWLVVFLRQLRAQCRVLPGATTGKHAIGNRQPADIRVGCYADRSTASSKQSANRRATFILHSTGFFAHAQTTQCDHRGDVTFAHRQIDRMEGCLFQLVHVFGFLAQCIGFFPARGSVVIGDGLLQPHRIDLAALRQCFQCVGVLGQAQRTFCLQPGN